MEKINKLIKSFRDKGLKITPQRLAIFKILENNNSHPSAEQIYHNLKRGYPTISLATVYKTLEILEEMGEVKLLKINYDRKRYDPDCSPHHHLICVGCRKIVDIFEDYSNALKVPSQIKDEFTITDFRVEFFGLCKKCKNKRKFKEK